jgi:hypothetical protein
MNKSIVFHWVLTPFQKFGKFSNLVSLNHRKTSRSFALSVAKKYSWGVIRVIGFGGASKNTIF